MPTATEPLFLAERRRQARELVPALRLPGTPDEDWRRTSLEGLDLDNFKPVSARAALTGNAPEGVIFTDILTAAAEHPDLVAKYLGARVDLRRNKLTAANALHLSGGLFLYVPKNVEITEPLYVTYEAAEGEAQYLHTVVVADTNSAVTVFERYEGSGEYLSVAVVEVFPMDGAKVRYGYLQNHSEDAWSFTLRATTTSRDSIADWVGGDFGGGLVRSEMVSDVAGQGSTSRIKVVYGANGNQHFNILASGVHTGPESSSSILGRGVLSGKAHTVFWGNGEIKAGAVNCSTYQRQQALVLSEKARADAIPALIIDENEVAGAGHAATVGKLDEDQLFYLMARGLSRAEATRMLVLAFLSPVLDKIPAEELREEMIRLMGEKVNV